MNDKDEKRIIEYSQIPSAIGDYLASVGVSLKKDFSEQQQEQFRKALESYMKPNSAGIEKEPLVLDFGKVEISISDVDHAGHLYFALTH